MFVPHYAMSGGTLISLAADEIVMDPNAVLGPVDPQLGESPAASILTVLDRKKPEDIDDETFIKADVSKKAIAQVRRTAQDLLSERMSAEQAAALAEKLSTGTWTHDYPITAEEAKALGLPVSTEMPREVYEFMGLFAQPTRTRPSVEYVPCPTGRARNRASDLHDTGLRRRRIDSSRLHGGFPGDRWAAPRARRGANIRSPRTW